MHDRAGTRISRTLRRAALTVAVTIATMGTISDSAHAGVGISPVSMEFSDALRGASYTQTMMLTNTDPDDPAEFTVVATGDIAPWVTTSLGDGERTTSFVVAPSSRLNIRVHLDVPDDAVNRTYDGGLEVLGAVAGTAAGAGVQIGGVVLIEAHVTGTEIRSAGVDDYRVANAEVGMDQRFTAIVRNDGNVRAIAQLDVAIQRDGDTVAELSTGGEPWVVEGAASSPVEVTWPTAEQSAGDYTALFTVSDVAGSDPIELGRRELAFRLEPLGTFTRAGVLGELAIVSDVGLDTPIVAEATFTNTGQIDTTAIFEGRVYRGDELVQVVQSLGQAASPGAMVPMTFSFSLDTPGAYRLEGSVNYDGFVTDAKSLEFEIAGVSPVVDGSGSVDRTVVAAAAAALLGVLLVLGVVLVRRRRRTARAELRRVTPARTAARQPATTSRSAPVSPTAATSAEALRPKPTRTATPVSIPTPSATTSEALPSTPTPTPTSDVRVAAGLGDPWFANLDEGQIDPDLFATALAELDEELGLGSSASRSGGPD